ncbi:2OG-Fe(II) oxygenase [Halobacteriovorax sp. HLS]|uniref:2OG-Fe(II) oxygenase family protein n=1 Tax=Halobacteriovorax sp. HLS TaxID=2234000 RepID=UPI000FD9CD6A|nr:2OG-Fe(II) oxygenase [Halobacteriovorax sp. HLS]
MSFIQEYENILSPKNCESIIENYLKESHIDTKRSDANLHGIVKEWSIPQERHWSDLFLDLNEKCRPIVESYLSYSTLLNCESYYLKHISIMEHQENFNIPYHYDAEISYMNDKEYIRNFAILIYLNDNFESGELIFPIQKTSIKPKVGLGLIFPTSFMFPHLTNPAIGANRYVLRMAYYFKKDSIINSTKTSKDYF